MRPGDFALYYCTSWQNRENLHFQVIGLFLGQVPQRLKTTRMANSMIYTTHLLVILQHLTKRSDVFLHVSVSIASMWKIRLDLISSRRIRSRARMKSMLKLVK